MYIVEEIDGHRDVWEMHVENDLDIKLPQGQAVEIGGKEGKTVLFWRLSKVFVEYETVRLLGERLRALKPHERNRYLYAVPFLDLLGGKNYDKEELLRIANRKVRS